jgi:hypothetical protein
MNDVTAAVCLRTCCCAGSGSCGGVFVKAQVSVCIVCRVCTDCILCKRRKRNRDIKSNQDLRTAGLRGSKVVCQIRRTQGGISREKSLF